MGDGEDGRQRIGDALAGDVGGGAVHGFEKRREAAGRVEVGARRQADAAGDDGGEIAQDVAEEVRCDDDIEGGRTPHEVHRRGIDQQRFGVRCRDNRWPPPEDTVPQHHAVALGVGLGDRVTRCLLLRRRAQFERIPDDALAAVAGEDGRLHGDFVGEMVVDEAADGRVFAFGVLAHDHHVDGARRGAFSGEGTPSYKYAGRTLA